MQIRVGYELIYVTVRSRITHTVERHAFDLQGGGQGSAWRARAFCKKGRGCLSPQGLTLAPDAGSRIVSADVARCLTEPCSDCGGYYHVRGDDKKDATKSATWVCGTCRFRKVINYHNGGLRREVTVELVTQLNEMLKCKDGVDRSCIVWSNDLLTGTAFEAVVYCEDCG